MQRSFGFYHEVLTDYARKLIRRKARRLMRRPEFSRIDEDDIAQEITMHLLSQSAHYDPTRGAAGAFVSVVIDSAISNLIRRERRLSKEPADIESLTTTIDVPGEPPASLESLVTMEDGKRRTRMFTPSELQMIDDKDAFDHVFEKLPANLKRICSELMSVSPVVAARNLGITRHQMRDAMSMIGEYFSALE